MIQLRALRQLTGDYGSVPFGGVFWVEEKTALLLESKGLVERVLAQRPPAVLEAHMMGPYENKMLMRETKKQPAKRKVRKRS